MSNDEKIIALLEEQNKLLAEISSEIKGTNQSIHKLVNSIPLGF